MICLVDFGANSSLDSEKSQISRTGDSCSAIVLATPKQHHVIGTKEVPAVAATLLGAYKGEHRSTHSSC